MRNDFSNPTDNETYICKYKKCNHLISTNNKIIIEKIAIIKSLKFNVVDKIKN